MAGKLLKRGHRLVTGERPMQSAAPRVRMTYRDLLKLPDDGCATS